MMRGCCRVFIVAAVLLALVAIAHAQWGTAEQKHKTKAKLMHSPPEHKGAMQFQKPAYQRNRRYMLNPEDNRVWNGAPPGAAEKQKRLERINAQSGGIE
eukprot:CAMPEP_0114605804 /NCGR_PEP_ID=MMETSP0168-20121206/1241_1 /TAXON_ID=95228 ORGANISM="Vannella sp., Strain DIVA3 517/6/12" /NCGR_SAMPLE_ID=MMETSP0168 /ASSEMBLY_ACC=CAM_ASM_000044 /LENGTH=98 /DNA_ID=CAMNT_0001816661 /DNA_START=194 /DNA_END=490 /DNA_ORIENTATION=-